MTTSGNMKQMRTPRVLDFPRPAAILLFLTVAFAMAVGVSGSVLLADELRGGASQRTNSLEQEPKIAFLRLGIGTKTNVVRLIEARVVPGRLKPQVAARRTVGWLEFEAVEGGGKVLWRRWDPDPSLARYEYATPADGSGKAGGLAWTEPSPRGEGEYQCMVRIPWDAQAITLRIYRNAVPNRSGDYERLQTAAAVAAEGTSPESLRVLVGTVSLANVWNQAAQKE